MGPTVAASLLALSGILLGCAETRLFEPADEANSQALASQGRPAMYHIAPDPGARGDVKVWASELTRGRHRSVARVLLELRNTGEVPWSVDLASASLAPVVSRGVELAAVPPIGASTERVSPGSDRTISLQFALPGSVNARDVVGLRVHCLVRAGEHTYSYSFPFVRAPEPEAPESGI